MPPPDNIAKFGYDMTWKNFEITVKAMHFPRLEATLFRLQPIILRSTTTPALKLSGYMYIYILY